MGLLFEADSFVVSDFGIELILFGDDLEFVLRMI